MLPMKLSQLRTFVAIADHGGFARAADRIGLTQSAASRQISALEEELGVLLFDRIGHRVRLTSEGEDLLRRSRRLLVDVEAIGERARALKAAQTGLLRVGATPQVIENLLAEFLVRHRSCHPGIEVDLVEDGGARLPARLEQGDVHLAIMPMGHERFQGRLLYPMYLLAALSTKHPMGKRPVLEITALADEPLLLMSPGHASLTWFDAAARVANIRPRVRLQSGSPHTLIELAKSGYGISVPPSPVRFPSEGVRTVPLVHRGASIGTWAVVAWDGQRFLAPYAERFIDELVASVRVNYPGRKLTRRAPPLPRPKNPVS
jgi:DNA-binding transcriptional LysR family regulator